MQFKVLRREIMSVDPDVIKELLAHLREYVSRIDNMDFEPHELHEDVDVQDLVAHRLHTAVETMIDISMHIASGLNLPKRDDSASVIKLLGKERILSDNLVKRLTGAPGARNVIVHEYHNVDFQDLEKNLDQNIIDLKDYAKEIVEYLEKEEII